MVDNPRLTLKASTEGREPVAQGLTIAGPVVYYLFGGEKAKTELDALKGWLAVHNVAVMTVLFLVLGVLLIAKGIAPLTA